MRLVKIASALMVLVLVAQPMLGADEEREKVPAGKELEKAEAIIKDLFKAEFAKLKAADKLDLAAKLYEQGIETKDDSASRYMLLKLSMDTAAQAGDLAQAMKAAEDLGRLYAVNGAELKVGVFEKLAPAVKGADENKALAEDVLQAVSDAIQADDFDTAERLIKVAAAAAAKSKSVPLVSAVNARDKAIPQMRKDFAKVKDALATLEKKPKDAEANGVAGTYFCLVKGDWDRGLILLAQGKDAKLKALAEKDATATDAPPAQMELADAWYELGNGADFEPAYKTQALARALFWYNQAAGGLTGLAKTKAEKRIGELEKVAGASGRGNETFTFIRDAIRNKETKDSAPQGGGSANKEFRDVPKDAAILIGFDVGLTKVGKADTIDYLRPLWLTASGERPGTAYGKAPDKDKLKTVKAKPGYAVAGLTVRAGGGIDAILVSFMRIGKKGLKKDDKYDSEIFGGRPNLKLKAEPQPGDGSLLIGLQGKLLDDGKIGSLGFVLVPPKAEK